MAEKLNQLVIEKVENGFIFTAQVKKETASLFGSSEQFDKLHYVAKDQKDLIKELEKVIPNLATGTEVKEALKKATKEEEGDEDDE